jgi:hypothetical protein
VALNYPAHMVRDVERRWQRQWHQPIAAARLTRIRPDMVDLRSALPFGTKHGERSLAHHTRLGARSRDS